MDIQPLVDYYLKQIELTEEQIRILPDFITERHYLKGQYVLQQGDICKHSNFIVKGCVKMSYQDREANEHIVMFGVENWWVSDLGSFISGLPADYNIQCIEPTTILQFTKENDKAFIKAIPQLEGFYSKLLQNALVSAYKRITINHSHTAKERYVLFKTQYPNMEQRIPQYMIASYLGITKEFFSKMKKEVLFGE